MRKLATDNGRLLIPIAAAVTLLAAAFSGADERPTQASAQPSDEASTPNGPDPRCAQLCALWGAKTTSVPA